MNKAVNYIRRWFIDAEALQSGVGVAATVFTIFTASRPVLVVGWRVQLRLVKSSGDDAALQRAISTAYVSLDQSLNNQFDLALTRAEHNLSPEHIVGENIPAYIVDPPLMERHLTDREAEDLGLLLGYGASIYFAVGLEVKVGGSASACIKGHLFYREM